MVYKLLSQSRPATLPNSKIAFIGVPVSILKLPSKELESSLGPITLKRFWKIC